MDGVSIGPHKRQCFLQKPWAADPDGLPIPRATEYSTRLFVEDAVTRACLQQYVASDDAAVQYDALVGRLILSDVTKPLVYYLVDDEGKARVRRGCVDIVKTLSFDAPVCRLAKPSIMSDLKVRYYRDRDSMGGLAAVLLLVLLVLLAALVLLLVLLAAVVLLVLLVALVLLQVLLLVSLAVVVLLAAVVLLLVLLAAVVLLVLLAAVVVVVLLEQGVGLLKLNGLHFY